jgi:hypothetical protein
MSDVGVEDAASERILVQNTPKDIDLHSVLIQNSHSFNKVKKCGKNVNLI